MNAIELLVLDLVRVAETPLYSAYRWLDFKLARRLSLPSFFDLVGELIERDVVRLWSVDASTGDRTELYGVPDALLVKYSEITDADETFDPFGFSLTVGAIACDDIEAVPDWSFDVDAKARVFELRAPGHAADAVLHDLGKILSDLVLRRSAVRRLEDGKIAINGSVEQRSNNAEGVR